MNTDDWKPFYKINPLNGWLIETNLIYTPLVNPENNILCMSFDHTSKYQTTDLERWLPARPDYTEEMVKFFFERELLYLNIFKYYSWAPKVLEVDHQNQKIFIEWPGETCNQIVYGDRKIEEQCPDWKEQMTVIINDIITAGYYKVSLYPHCYYIVDGKLHTFDFYGCAEQADPYVDLDTIRGMIGTKSNDRFDAAVKDNKLNVGILFKEAMSTYVKWPDDFLPTLRYEHNLRK